MVDGHFVEVIVVVVVVVVDDDAAALVQSFANV